MFLIEYKKGCFINGELIDWIRVSKESIDVTVTTDNENEYKVEGEFIGQFLNNLQAIDGNLSSLEKAYLDASG